MVKIFDPDKILDVTFSAAKHFKKHMIKNPQNIGIYIGTKVMGCSGLVYDVRFVTDIPDGVTKVKLHNLNFFLSDESMNCLKGLKIDYVKHDVGQYRLEYTNPNESARCGCGESFKV